MPKGPTTIAESKALIAKHKLDDHRDLIIGGLRKAVRLEPGKPVKRRLPTGTSKFGGEPDLPDDADWPTYDGRPLHFVAQLNLADLPQRHIPTADLPRKGLLSFWYDTQGDRVNGLRDMSSQRYRVLYHTKQGGRRSFPAFDGDRLDKDFSFFFWRPFPERRVAMQPMLTLDEGVHARLSGIAMDEARDEYEFVVALEGGGFGSAPRLLGSYWDFQDDPREHAAAHAAGFDPFELTSAQQKKIDGHLEQWRLLALFDSDRQVNDWMWGDEGQLGFWIRDEDLKNRRFNSVYGALSGC